jgi:hypothetical protein
LPVGLSEDQKAMLRLLAQREQGYDDIAALMGLTVEQVRERVKDALKQLDEEQADAGELRPAGSVPGTGPSSSRAAGEDPVPAPPAGQSSAEAAGAAQAPVEIPPAPQPSQASAEGSPSPKLRLALPSGQGARAAIAAGVAALVLVVVILVVGGSGDDSSDSTTASNPPAGAEGEPTSGNVRRQTKAVLSPVAGAEGGGVATFGRVKNRLALQVEAEGLKATADGRSYAVWLAESPQKMLPLASTAVGDDGRIAAQFEVPTEVLGYLANETFDQIVITEAVDSTLRVSLQKATSEKKAPAYTGTEVLQGQITGPIIGAAKK